MTGVFFRGGKRARHRFRAPPRETRRGQKAPVSGVVARVGGLGDDLRRVLPVVVRVERDVRSGRRHEGRRIRVADFIGRAGGDFGGERRSGFRGLAAPPAARPGRAAARRRRRRALRDVRRSLHRHSRGLGDHADRGYGSGDRWFFRRFRVVVRSRKTYAAVRARSGDRGTPLARRGIPRRRRRLRAHEGVGGDHAAHEPARAAQERRRRRGRRGGRQRKRFRAENENVSSRERGGRSRSRVGASLASLRSASAPLFFAAVVSLPAARVPVRLGARTAASPAGRSRTRVTEKKRADFPLARNRRGFFVRIPLGRIRRVLLPDVVIARYRRAFSAFLRRPRVRHLARARRDAHGLAAELQVPCGAEASIGAALIRDDEHRGFCQQVERHLVARALDVRAPRVTPQVLDRGGLVHDVHVGRDQGTTTFTRRVGARRLPRLALARGAPSGSIGGPIVGTPSRSSRVFALRAVAQHVGGARVRLEVVPQRADDHLIHAARRGGVGVARQRLGRGDEGPAQEVEVRRVVPGPAQRGGRDGRSGVATRVSRGSLQRHDARVRAAKHGGRFRRSLFLPPALDDVGFHRVAATRHRPIGASLSRPRLYSGLRSACTTPVKASASDARGHRTRLDTRRSLLPRPPGRASRCGGRRGPARSDWETKIPVVAFRESRRSFSLVGRLLSVSGARGWRCGWYSARWAPSARPRPWSRGPRWGTARCSARPRRRARAVPPSAARPQPRRPHRNHPSCAKRRDARRTTDWPSPSTRRSSGTSS